jgi:hypothetical protein
MQNCGSESSILKESEQFNKEGFADPDKSRPDPQNWWNLNKGTENSSEFL